MFSLGKCRLKVNKDITRLVGDRDKPKILVFDNALLQHGGLPQILPLVGMTYNTFLTKLFHTS